MAFRAVREFTKGANAAEGEQGLSLGLNNTKRLGEGKEGAKRRKRHSRMWGLKFRGKSHEKDHNF